MRRQWYGKWHVGFSPHNSQPSHSPCPRMMGSYDANEAIHVEYPHTFQHSFFKVLKARPEEPKFRDIHLSGRLVEQDQDRKLWFMPAERKVKVRTYSPHIPFSRRDLKHRRADSRPRLSPLRRRTRPDGRHLSSSRLLWLLRPYGVVGSSPPSWARGGRYGPTSLVRLWRSWQFGRTKNLGLSGILGWRSRGRRRWLPGRRSLRLV